MDNAASVAFNNSAPKDERAAASIELQSTAIPRSAGDLLPAGALTPFIQQVLDQVEEQEMSKALMRQNMINLPPQVKRANKPGVGMQSVFLDDMQINVMGDWYERPGAFNFDGMRAMVEQTPILNAVIMTRQRQIQRFCRPQDMDHPGFQIRLKDKDASPSPEDRSTMKAIEGFFLNSGWETRARTRMRMHRDNFSTLMMKLTRDTLTMDSMPIETEWKRDARKGLDGIYAVDGATIRLCTESGYRGNDEIFALQVVQGMIRNWYSYEDLIYVARNPRTDVMIGNYGLSETELLIRVVTGFLNAFTYNTKYFDTNTIPKGLLHLHGNYTDADMNAFKRYWNAMVKGVNNAWGLPVLVSKDQESKASFEKFGVEVDEMMFGRWMTFLTSLICAIYGIAPDEINFESFGMGKSSLSGDDTAEKVSASKDKGLLPLLSYFDNTFSDFIVSEFGDKYEFEWTGLDAEDRKQSFEEVKLCGTVNELRASRGEEKIKDAWGDAPLNANLIGVWQQEQATKNMDFGMPVEEKKDFGDPDADPEDGDADEDEDLSKSFGLPVLRFET